MQPDSGYGFQEMVFNPFILSLNFPEHLKVTTRLGASIISSPVAGFRPLRSRLFQGWFRLFLWIVFW